MENPMKTEPDITELLDEIGLDFALHTHHPLTHMELGDEAPEAVKLRLNCTDPT
jgi:hypothetical protein